MNSKVEAPLEYNPFEEEPIQLAIDGVPIIIYLDKQGLTHMERDYRVYEADRENPYSGHEFRQHQEIQDPIE